MPKNQSMRELREQYAGIGVNLDKATLRLFGYVPGVPESIPSVEDFQLRNTAVMPIGTGKLLQAECREDSDVDDGIETNEEEK